MYRSAFKSILSELARQERLLLIDQLTLAAPKTRELVALLKQVELKRGLIVIAEDDVNLFLAARNIPHIDVVLATNLNPVNLVAYDNVLMTVAAVKKLEEKLS